MPTLTTAIIAQSGGDYTSLSSWEATENKDLVAADEQHTATISGSWSVDDSTETTIDGWTVDSTRYIRIIAQDGSEAQMPPSATSYRLKKGFNSSTNLLTIGTSFTRIENLYLYASALASITNNVYTIFITSAANDVLIKNCYIKAEFNWNSNGSSRIGNISISGDRVTIVNSILWFNNAQSYTMTDVYAIRAANQPARECRVYNCTIYTDDAFQDLRVIDFSVTNLGNELTNTIVWAGTGPTVEEIFSANLSGSNNATNKTGAPGAGSRDSQTFTFVDAANGDFHLDGGDLGALGYGADLSADSWYAFNDDFDGETRTGDWDIGADQTPPPSGKFLKVSHPNFRVPNFNFS